MANRMSLFYAEATPMLKTLSNATTKFVSEVGIFQPDDAVYGSDIIIIIVPMATGTFFTSHPTLLGVEPSEGFPHCQRSPHARLSADYQTMQM